MSGSDKPGDLKGATGRAQRLKAALRDNLKRRKAQEKARARAAQAAEPNSAGIAAEIARSGPKG
jgi:hypothetical protein